MATSTARGPGDAVAYRPPDPAQGAKVREREPGPSGQLDLLAWKLDLVLRGLAPEALLESYMSERAPHVAATIEISVALGRVICVADPAEAAARDRRMLAQDRDRASPVDAAPPPLGDGCLASGSPAAGQLFVQDLVRHRGVSALFDDAVGRGFALVSPLGDPGAALDAENAAWFASLGGFTAHVAEGAPIDDAKGGYARWFARHGAGLALVRPDFAVFGTAPGLDAAPALVAELRRRLAS